MIDKKMEEALNKHMNAELYSWYLYLAMAAHFESEGLQGCANWMKLQAQEEMVHGMKFYQYVNDRGGSVKLDKIDKPKGSWKSVAEVFDETLEHEKKVTAGIHKLVDQAIEIKDHATSNFLQWFVNEQVEEEASAEQIINQIKLAGDSGRGLYFLDRELGARQG